MAKRSNIKLVVGQLGLDKEGRIEFPPENAKTKSLGRQFMEIDLVEGKNKGITR